MLKRIKYVSRASRSLTLDDIDRLAEQSVHRNMDHGITGVLMVSGGLFFQVIEGLEPQVDDLYSRIVRDERHSDVVLLSEEEGVQERLFPDWAMEKIHLDDGTADRLEPLQAMLEAIVALKKHPEETELVRRLSEVLGRAVWRELVDEG